MVLDEQDRERSLVAQPHDEVAELLDLRFGSARVFPVLATLYPGLDLTKSFHEDHIFPRSRFTRSRLSRAGIPSADIDDYLARVDMLPNLQLLAGTDSAIVWAFPWLVAATAAIGALYALFLRNRRPALYAALGQAITEV